LKLRATAERRRVVAEARRVSVEDCEEGQVIKE
jgi:hypothetical protein